MTEMPGAAPKEAAENREPSIRVIMMPKDTNAHGTIFGGVILSYIDQAGAVEAKRHGADFIVTVAMREVVFSHPVHVGDIVSCYVDVLRVGRTSVTVCVRVVAHRPTDTRRSIDVTKAEVVYVAIDDSGRPIPVAEGDQI